MIYCRLFLVQFWFAVRIDNDKEDIVNLPADPIISYYYHILKLYLILSQNTSEETLSDNLNFI